MKIKFVYGILPAIIVYTNNIADTRFGAIANGPLIRMRPKYITDHGLHEHELTHVKQWWRTLGLHGLLYAMSARYRLNSEIEAYREQLKFGSASDVVWMTTAIQTKYDLNVSREKISELLQQ